ncbi:MAG: hypothetical protein HY565_03020 [Candidatus Kerfeldbacteria bacterium]|nr:hypothetical protein [Candidatus Kerfeldbacteria bacterium]
MNKKQSKWWLVVLLVLLLLFGMTTYWYRGTILNTNTVDSTTADPWLLVTDTVTIAVTPDTAQSTCEINWLNNSVPAELSFYTITATGEERPLAYTAEPCRLIEDIRPLPYVGVELGGEPIGGLEPPSLPYSAIMALGLPDNPTTVYPTNGYWRYTMTADTSNLNCSIDSFAAVGASGQVQLAMSDYGFTANLITDDNAIGLYRLQYQATDYESPTYSFPLLDGYGEVQWKFTATDQEHMTGTLHVTGDSCVGEYPLTMALETPTVPPLYIPGQGSWTLNYGPLVCGSTVLSPSQLNLPIGNANLTVTGGGPLPMTLTFVGAPSGVQLTQTMDTNQYSSVPNLYLGVAIDPITSLPFTLMGTLNLTAVSEAQLVGTLLIQGTNGCVAGGVVQFQQ